MTLLMKDIFLLQAGLDNFTKNKTAYKDYVGKVCCSALCPEGK